MRGDKRKYSDKQKRKAEHIEEGYERRGTSADEAKRRAWATVNKESGGGNLSGSGRGKKDTHVSSRRGGHALSAATRSAAAKKAGKPVALIRINNGQFACHRAAGCGDMDYLRSLRHYQIDNIEMLDGLTLY